MKRYIISILIGLFLIGFGCGYLWIEIMNFSFINEIPSHSFNEKHKTYEFALSEHDEYYFVSNNVNLKLQVDEELDNQILVNVAYYLEFGDVDYRVRNIYGENTIRYIEYSQKDVDGFSVIKSLQDSLFQDLKDKSIHNYSLLVRPNVVITVPKDKQAQVLLIQNKDWMDDFFEED